MNKLTQMMNERQSYLSVGGTYLLERLNTSRSTRDLDDQIDECADCCVPIYTSDLTKWLNENGSAMRYLEKVVSTSAYDTDSSSSVESALKAAAFHFYDDQIRADLDDVLYCAALQYLIDLDLEEISEEMIDEFVSAVQDNDEADFSDTYEEISSNYNDSDEE